VVSIGAKTELRESLVGKRTRQAELGRYGLTITRDVNFTSRRGSKGSPSWGKKRF